MIVAAGKLDHVSEDGIRQLVDAFYVMLEDGKKDALVPALAQAGYRFNSITTEMLAFSRMARV